MRTSTVEAFGGYRILPLGLLLILLACGGGDGDGATGPPAESIAGSYAATNFKVTDSGTTIDVLAQGGSLSITLTSQNATTGRLFVPGGGEGGVDLDADLVGTWTLSAGTVRFTQAADTFLRDIAFTVNGQTLVSQDSAGGAVFDIVLSR